MNNWHKYVADKIYDTELSYKTVSFVSVCLSVHLPIRMYHHTRQDTDRESMTESFL